MDRESTLSLQPGLALISQSKPFEATSLLLKVPTPPESFPMPSEKPWHMQQIFSQSRGKAGAIRWLVSARLQVP